MKAAVAYEVLYFFENLFILERLILEISSKLANITFKHFTKRCFTLWFYNVIKTMGKRKEENDTFLNKKRKTNKTALP